jgi:hypothetical protein
MRRLGIALALLALAGCGDDGAADELPPAARACTEIGCNSLAEVRFVKMPRGRLWIRLCADERCELIRSDGRGLVRTGVPLAEGTGDTVRVSVTIRRHDRTRLRVAERLPVETSRPNGPDCPPVCRYAASRLDVATGRLEPL